MPCYQQDYDWRPVVELYNIVSTVRHVGCAHQGLGAVVSSLVNRNYHVKHAKVAGTTLTTVLACLRSLAHDEEFVPAFEMDAFDSDVMAESGDSDDE